MKVENVVVVITTSEPAGVVVTTAVLTAADEGDGESAVVVGAAELDGATDGVVEGVAVVDSATLADPPVDSGIGSPPICLFARTSSMLSPAEAASTKAEIATAEQKSLQLDQYIVAFVLALDINGGNRSQTLKLSSVFRARP